MPGVVNAGQGTLLTEYHGYAIADKERGSRELKVFVPALLPMLTGELKAIEQDNDVLTTAAGTNFSYSGLIKTKNYLLCQYKNDDPNSLVVPLVRKGEQVIVSNYANTDVWYWRSAGRNDNERRTDTYKTGVSGNLVHNAKLTDDNTYFMEMDTREKHQIKLSTSKQDGEKYRYTIQADADNSRIVVSDDIENKIIIESDPHRISIINKDNSMIILDKKNIVIKCDGEIIMESTSSKVTIHGGSEINVKSPVTNVESPVNVTA